MACKDSGDNFVVKSEYRDGKFIEFTYRKGYLFPLNITIDGEPVSAGNPIPPSNISPRPIIHGEDLWQERTWGARREGDRYFFEFLAAGHGRGADTYEITKEEFEGVKAGQLTFDDLLRLTDGDPHRAPFKQT